MSEKPRITSEMLFVVSTTGDGCNSILVQGREELRAALLSALWMGTAADAPEDVTETVDSLDNSAEEWSGDYYPNRDPFWSWYRNYEDGSITVQRVITASCRVSELLAANNAEVERRRKVEAAIDRLRAQVERLGGSPVA